MAQDIKTAFVAGATGYLGRRIVAELLSRGYEVKALVRPGSDTSGLPGSVEQIEAEATAPATLDGIMQGVDMVISALGLTRQTDRLSYMDVDYQANLNLLREAVEAGVKRFAYVHVLTRGTPASDLVAAKARFVATLQTAPLETCVIRPNGFFSDMEAILEMAKRGRVWLIGNGSVRINPIDGSDLAAAILDGLEADAKDIEIGGPQILSLDQIADLAFLALDRRSKITHLPLWVGRAALSFMKRFAPRHIWGPFEFFLTSCREDAIGPCHGERSLSHHFKSLCSDSASADMAAVTSR
ncbi:SDR family oxidoreductase [Phycobacter azelaicus]|uniref:SDR family oxidoreductase n=1 Tax=Phycobacter azelaicus TaxID=2668075 RepID=UPI001867F81E|nr:SDR family oxidoreductase [Phycobacter azelaicus]